MAHKPTPLVSARQVLHALSEVRRRGRWPIFQDLEAAEPDLSEFLLEGLSAIYHELAGSSMKPVRVRRLQHRIQSLVLVCVLSLRGSRDDDGESAITPAEPPDPDPAE